MRAAFSTSRSFSNATSACAAAVSGVVPSGLGADLAVGEQQPGAGRHLDPVGDVA
jgi:hypothetical protein